MATYSYSEFNRIFSDAAKIEQQRTNTEFNASEWQAQQQQQQQQQQQSQQSSTDFISAPPPARHPLSRSASFVTAPTPLIVYSMPAPPPPSAIPPQQQQQQQLSDRLSAALLDSRCESRLIGDYSMPLYYALPPPTPQNAPQPIFLPFIPPNYMDTKQQMFCLPYDIGPPPMMTGPPTTNNIGGMRRKMKSAKRDEATGATSWCSRICCAGLAQLLWTVVCIISFGIIASLILALCYM